MSYIVVLNSVTNYDIYNSYILAYSIKELIYIYINLKNKYKNTRIKKKFLFIYINFLFYDIYI